MVKSMDMVVMFSYLCFLLLGVLLKEIPYSVRRRS
ncbi:hypothetical protein SAMN05518848_106359 [Paenibacillus sp. PDC88]|nr:hypothetical protein SAMN05518848_106359 [Paenibacillus sp. PDC88]